MKFILSHLWWVDEVF